MDSGKPVGRLTWVSTFYFEGTVKYQVSEPGGGLGWHRVKLGHTPAVKVTIPGGGETSLGSISQSAAYTRKPGRLDVGVFAPE